MGLGSRIRSFFRELFGSRVAERLEEALLRQRSDFEARLQDKDLIIADLRAEKAQMLGKLVLYERSLLPLTSKAGADVVNGMKPTKPNFGIDFSVPRPMTRWEQVQAEHEKELAAQEAEEAKQKAQGA